MRIHMERKFDAAHKLSNPAMDAPWNSRVYGKCCNLHGHTWKVTVDIEGPVIKETGMVINFNEIKNVVDQFDHNLVNAIVAVPTAENLVAYILERLVELGPFTMVKVRVWESETAYAEDTWGAE